MNTHLKEREMEGGGGGGAGDEEKEEKGRRRYWNPQEKNQDTK